MAQALTLKDLLTEPDVDSRVEQLGFEDGLRLLEELVSKVESGSLALDKAIVSYEKGVLLIDRLRNLLSGAEEKIKTLQKGNNGRGGEKSKRS